MNTGWFRITVEHGYRRRESNELDTNLSWKSHAESGEAGGGGYIFHFYLIKVKFFHPSSRTLNLKTPVDLNR